MQSLLELQQSAGSSFEFIESVKSDLFPDEIYVFTPEGRIVELPTGATPVDFAYAVHTDIGHACVGARVDRQPPRCRIRLPVVKPSKSLPHRAHGQCRVAEFCR
ncbi:TGS domain-containing protein [Shigella boydii]